MPDVVYDPSADTRYDELFRGFFRPARLEGAASPVTIKLDVSETNSGYVVHSEMPGVKRDDIAVAIAGNQVTITGEVKQQWEKTEGDTILRSERYFGNIYRSFTLPAELEESACEATYENGILELKLVRKAAAPERRLAIP